MKKLVVLLLSLTVLIGVLTGCKTNESKKVKLGYVNWSEGIAMTNLAAVILEDKMGYEVDMTLADVAPIFTSVASGNTDAFLDTWLPLTHEDHLEKYGDDIELLDASYENARIGLVVPAYMEINSIEELNSIKNDLDGEIIGIDSGAGIMKATEKAIEDYELDLELITGSGPTMTAALKKAIDNHDPIVVTGWSPHWKFNRFELKFLDDPKNSFGDVEDIHIITRKDLKDDKPEVYEFLSNLKFSDSVLSDLMGSLNDSDDIKEAARKWMNDNIDIVNEWIPESK